MDLLSPRRPLKPQRRARRVPKPHNVNVSSVNLVVRIVRAVDVPLRDGGGGGVAGGGGGGAGGGGG